MGILHRATKYKVPNIHNDTKVGNKTHLIQEHVAVCVYKSLTMGKCHFSYLSVIIIH